MVRVHHDTPVPPPASPMRRWLWKFSCALRGVLVGMQGQSSFYVHVPAAIVVCIVAAWLGVSLAEWLVLVLCITVVMTAELLNSALEHLARAVTREVHPEVRNALDIASGAVLVASLGACVVGVMVLVNHWAPVVGS